MTPPQLFRQQPDHTCRMYGGHWLRWRASRSGGYHISIMDMVSGSDAPFGVFSCVVDSDPRFHFEALRWYATLRRVAAVQAHDMVVNAVGGTDSDILNFLRSQGVAVEAIEPFAERWPWCNKISGAIRLAERGVEGSAVLTDTDFVVLEDPRRLNIPPGAVASRLVGFPRPSLRILENIFETAGLEIPGLEPLDWRPRRVNGLRPRERRPLHHSRRNALNFGAFLDSVGKVADGARGASREFPHLRRPGCHAPRCDRIGDYSAQARHALEFPFQEALRAHSFGRGSPCGNPLPPERGSWGSLKADRHCSRGRADRLCKSGLYTGLARSLSERIDLGLCQ